jgi:hypothetical protein
MNVANNNMNMMENNFNMNMMGNNNFNNMSMIGNNNFNIDMMEKNSGMIHGPDKIDPMQQMYELEKQDLKMKSNFINFQSMNNINKQMNNMKINNNIYISVIFLKKDTFQSIVLYAKYDEKVSDMIKRYRVKISDLNMSAKFIFNGIDLQGIFDYDNNFHQGILKKVPTIKNGDPISDLTVEEVGISKNSIIYVEDMADIRGAGYWMLKQINIKFIKNNIKSNKIAGKKNSEIMGLLKLSLLKEISVKLDDDQLEK